MPDTAFWVSYGLLWAVVALLCVFMLATLRHLGLLFEAVDPILRFNRHPFRVKIDDPLPRVPLVTTSEQPMEIAVPAGSLGLVLVVQRNCSACATLLDGLKALLGGSFHPSWKPILIVIGNGEAAEEIRRRHEIPSATTLLVDHQGATPREWGVAATPFAFVVDDALKVRQKFPSPVIGVLHEMLTTDAAVANRPVHGGVGRDAAVLQIAAERRETP